MRENMGNWVKAHRFLNLQELNSAIDEIMRVCREATKTYEQAIIAMGQKSTATHSEVASTKVVMNLTPDLSSGDDRKSNGLEWTGAAP